MKRVLTILLALMLLTSASAEYWTDVTERPVVCCDGRTGCQVLQMVMMGSFSELDPTDSLNTRVMSAVFPMLLDISDDEFEHFCDEFSVEEHVIRKYYYIALGNCLWADMLTSTQVEDDATATARRILLLFLNPEGEQNAGEQIFLIRRELNYELIEKIAEEANLPVGFVEYIMNTEDWKNPEY